MNIYSCPRLTLTFTIIAIQKSSSPFIVYSIKAIMSQGSYVIVIYVYSFLDLQILHNYLPKIPNTEIASTAIPSIQNVQTSSYWKEFFSKMFLEVRWYKVFKCSIYVTRYKRLLIFLQSRILNKFKMVILKLIGQVFVFYINILTTQFAEA